MNGFLSRCFQIRQVTILLLASSSLHAQSPGTGAIAGIVADPSGAVLTKATVLVISDETHVSRSVSTSPEGEFRVALLPPVQDARRFLRRWTPERPDFRVAARLPARSRGSLR